MILLKRRASSLRAKTLIYAGSFLLCVSYCTPASDMSEVYEYYSTQMATMLCIAKKFPDLATEARATCNELGGFFRAALQEIDRRATEKMPNDDWEAFKKKARSAAYRSVKEDILDWISEKQAADSISATREIAKGRLPPRIDTLLSEFNPKSVERPRTTRPVSRVSGTEQASARQHFGNVSVGFSLAFPSDWQQLERSGNLLFLQKAVGGEEVASVYIGKNYIPPEYAKDFSILAAGKSQEMLDVITMGIKKSTPWHEVLDHDSATLDGVLAYRVNTRHGIRGFGIQRASVYLCVYDGHMYRVTFESTEKTYARLLKEFEAILQSFHFK